MSGILPYLLPLSCPVGMGLMMVLMRSKPQSASTTTQDRRLIELEEEVARLRQQPPSPRAPEPAGVTVEAHR